MSTQQIILVIVGSIVLVGIYIWSMRSNTPKTPINRVRVSGTNRGDPWKGEISPDTSLSDLMDKIEFLDKDPQVTIRVDDKIYKLSKTKKEAF